MSIDKKIALLPPSYREAMNLPVGPVGDVVDGRSTPMAVPASQPFQHDDWELHANDDELRAALRDLHVGTPTRTASPADMRTASPAPMRSYSPALVPPTRSFSPAPRSQSSAGSYRSFSPAPMDYMTSRHDGRGERSDFQPPNAGFMAPVMSSSPPPMHPGYINTNATNASSAAMGHARSPSAPAPREALPRPRPGLSPSRMTYPNCSHKGQEAPPPRRPPPAPVSTWDYTSQYARQSAHYQPTRREREHSAGTASSYSSYSSFSGRPREGSAASQGSLAHSYSSSFLGQVSPPVVSPPALSPPALSPPALSPPALSHTSSSPPSLVFSSPVSPPSATFGEFGAGTSPPGQFYSMSHTRSLSPHPTGSTYGRSPTPIHEHEDELKPSPVRRQFNASPVSINTISSVGTTGRRRPRPARFVCIMLSDTNRIRGVGLPPEIRGLISESLMHGAKGGIKDFCEVMPGVVEWKIQGHPWQDTAEAPRARRIVKRILSTLSSAGWHLVTAADLSRRDKEKDTLIFREGALIDRDFFVIGFGDADRLSLIDAPSEGVRAEFLKVVKSWPRGVQDYGEKSPGCIEARLAGAPWTGAAVDVACHARMLSLALLAAMEAEGYRLVASINLNNARKADTSAEVDSWVFAHKVGPPPQRHSRIM